MFIQYLLFYTSNYCSLVFLAYSSFYYVRIFCYAHCGHNGSYGDM